MTQLQLYQVSFTHCPPMFLMAKNLSHAIQTAKELQPNSQFMSAALVPEWEEDDKKERVNFPRGVAQ